MGARSGNLGCVDLDCSEATALAGRFLPPTATAGHGDNLETHWYYYTKEHEAGYLEFREVNSPKKLIELRADSGHYMALPPTRHPDGTVYAFKDSGLETQVLEAEELRQRVRALATTTLIARHLPEHKKFGGGGRHDLALCLAGLMLRDNRLEPDDVRAILLAAWDYKGYPSEKDRRDAHNDLVRAVSDTRTKLQEGKRVKGGWELSKMIPGLASKIADYWQWSDQTEQQGKGPDAPTHDELRDRWLEDNPDYAFGLGEWRRYDSGVWAVAKQPMVEAAIMRVLEEAKEEGIRPNGFVLSSVHKLARVEAYVVDEAWDGNPNIIVAANGAIDIETGDLLSHSPDCYCTSRVPYAFDENAEAPNWRRFVGDLDKDVATFLQEFAGYCLTTWTHFEKALWMVGPPGGGKSTFLEGLIAMLGERAGVLGLAEIERSPFALAKLVGKTLVTAAEQPAGYVTRHHIINAIISGELIQVERKYRDPYDIVPRAKIAWAMNEPPRIPSGAEGLFRRVEVIRFDGIDEGDRDPDLKEGIKEEGAGVLNWALEGLKSLRGRGGFAIPTTVKKSTEEFRRTNDIPALFVDELCDTGAGLFVKSSDLYDAYSGWCERNGHRAKSSTAVAEDWRRLGFKHKRTKNSRLWEGVDLKENAKFRGGVDDD